MNDAPQLKECFERGARAVQLRPALGRETLTATVRLRERLECEATDGATRLLVGMPPQTGGSGAGYDPGALCRAALRSCLAISFAQRAAVLGVPFESLEVELQTDLDLGGVLGVADTPPGYSEARFTVQVVSAAPESELRRALDLTAAQSIYLDALRRAIPTRIELRATQPAALAEAA